MAPLLERSKGSALARLLCSGKKGLKWVVSRGKGGLMFPRRKRAQHKTGNNHIPSCLSVCI